MSIDLNSMSRDELETLINDAEKALEMARLRERRMAREAAEKAAAEYGFSLEELNADAEADKKQRKSSGAKSKAAPRYANPNKPEQTWTGKGRQPNWYRAEIEKGTTPEGMEI